MSGLSQFSRDSVPSWNGKGETFENFVEKCRYWVLGTPPKERYLLGPRLLSSFGESTPHYRLGKTLLEEKLIADDGVTHLLDLLRTLCKKTPSEVAGKFREFLGPKMRRILCKESMLEYESRFEQTYFELGSALKTIDPNIDCDKLFHKVFLGIIYLEGSGLDASQQAAILATTANSST